MYAHRVATVLLVLGAPLTATAQDPTDLEPFLRVRIADPAAFLAQPRLRKCWEAAQTEFAALVPERERAELERLRERAWRMVADAKGARAEVRY